MSNAGRVGDAIVAATIAAVAAVLFFRLDDPLGVRPDSWSEAEVIVSGWGYAASGFLAHAGLPQHQIGPPVDPYYLYANYPVLSNVLYGVLERWGAEAGGLYRLPAGLASLVALGLWYRLVARVVDRGTAVAAVVALASSAGFLSYADNVHQQAYPMAPLFGALLCLVIGTAGDMQQPHRWLLGCAGCLLLLGLFSMEWHAWVVIAAAGYLMLFRRRVPWPWLPALLAALLAGVALQWMQSRVGAPVPAADRPSLTQSLYRRSIGFAAAPDTPRDAGGKTLTLATYPRYIASRIGEFYGLPVWLMPLLALAGFIGAPRRGPPTRWPASLKLLVILFAAALGWMATMMQQTAVHPATLRQLLPGWALLLAVVWTQAGRVALDPAARVVWRLLLPLAALALVVVQSRSAWSSLRMHRDADYRHPLLMDGGWRESADLAPLRDLPSDSVILTNHHRLPLIRYWSRRPTYLASFGLPRGAAGRRTWFDLSVSHLRGLYPQGWPHLVFLYRVLGPRPERVAAMLDRDPVLRLLTTGRFAPLTSDEAKQRAVRAFTGDGPAACPVLVRGRNWRVFDLAPIMPELRRYFGSRPIPKLKDMPPPR